MKFKVTPEDFLSTKTAPPAWKVSPEDFLKPLKAGKVDLSRFKLPKSKKVKAPKPPMPGGKPITKPGGVT